MARPLSSRKLDVFYLIFFTFHIPNLFFVDFVDYYPDSIRPAWTLQLRKHYIDTYRDLFFVSPPAWFHTYTFLELILTLPLSLLLVRALYKDHAQTPLLLFAFGMETAVTTITCLVEMLSWEGHSREEKNRLSTLYGPYLAIALLMSFDSFFRIRKVLNEHARLVTTKKGS